MMLPDVEEGNNLTVTIPTMSRTTPGATMGESNQLKRPRQEWNDRQQSISNHVSRANWIFLLFESIKQERQDWWDMNLRTRICTSQTTHHSDLGDSTVRQKTVSTWVATTIPDRRVAV